MVYVKDSSLLCRGTARAEGDVGPELSPQQCGGHDRELAFPMEGMQGRSQ